KRRARRRAGKSPGGVEVGSARDRRARAGRDQPDPPADRPDQPEQDARAPLVRDEGAPPRQRGIVVDARDASGLQDNLARLQVQEEIVVGDRCEVQGEQQESQRREGGRLAAPDGAGRQHGSYLSRDAMRALTVLPSTRPRWRAMNSFIARPRSFFSVIPSSPSRASTARAVSSAV